MNDDDYRILSLLYEEKSLTKTAQKLFISQPSLSYRIRKIEEEFGTKIIHKIGNQIKFTSEGEKLVRFSNKILYDLQLLKMEMHNMQEGLKGNIKIGANTNFAIYNMPELVKAYAEKYPQVYINMSSGWSIEVLEHIENNDIDIGIVTGEYNWTSEKILLKEDPLVIIHYKPIVLHKLPETYRIVYQSHQNYNTVIELENSISRASNIWWNERFKTPPKNIMQADKIEICKKFVQKEMGYSIVPKSCVLENDSFYIKELKSKNGNPFLRNTWLLYKEDRVNKEILDFIEFVKKYYEI